MKGRKLKLGEFKIIEAGPCTTVQDRGRYGYQRYGMPVAGAMDDFSYKMANLLVGNEAGAAVLEYTFQGPAIKFFDGAIIAVTGARAPVYLNGCLLPDWQSFFVPGGSVLSFARVEQGARSYIAFQGGLQVEEKLKSRSTYLRGEFGGYQGRKLKKDDCLEFYGQPQKTDYTCRYLPEKFIPDYPSEVEVRIILGPQVEYFSEEGAENFLKCRYKVTEQADRMGYRLEGPEIKHKDGADIISDGVAAGSIQVPGHQQPIILLADCQTTGGYPKIATVISVDLAKIAQLKPGDIISFREIELAEAHRLLEEREKLFQQIRTRKMKFGPSKFLNLKINEDNYRVMIEEIRD